MLSQILRAYPWMRIRSKSVSCKRLSLLALLVAVLGPIGCSSDNSTPAPRETGASVVEGIVGRVLFEKRAIDDAGRLAGSSDAELHTARFVRVEVLRPDGALIASTVTDVDGRFGVGGEFPRGFEVIAYPDSSASDDPLAIAVRVRDHQGSEYAASSGAQRRVDPGDRLVVDVIATVSSDLRLGGAFNIVDVMQQSGRLWRSATGIDPSLASVAWESGGTNQPGTFFDPTANQVSILGGRGNPDLSDTDEFDDTVVAHEYFHFLMHNHAHSSSPGGRHAGEDLVPNLAFEEGAADWFGAFVSGSARYQDTRGNNDGSPSCLVCDNVESSIIRQVEGIGSEQSVYEILWDLTDGLIAQPGSLDADQAAVPVEGLLQTIADGSRTEDYWYLGLFLDRLVARGAATENDVKAVLTFPVDHDVSFPLVERTDPPNGRDVFPIPIAFDEVLRGEVDAVTFGTAASVNIERGFDSIRYYRFELAERRAVRISLTILGASDLAFPCDAGVGQVPCDLDLSLLNVVNGRFAVSETEEANEVIDRTLDPGVYIVEVRGFFIDNPGNPAVGSSGLYELRIE